MAVFDQAGGVGLVDAVAASCAVPMVWPAATIGTERYFDGGIRSSANVDLAQGHDRIVVIAPQPGSMRRGGSPTAQLVPLAPSRSVVVSPDAAARKAMGRRPLDPSARAVSARSGLRQAERAAQAVQGVWP